MFQTDLFADRGLVISELAKTLNEVDSDSHEYTLTLKYLEELISATLDLQKEHMDERKHKGFPKEVH